MNDRQYSIGELEEQTGQSRRTIHHYISTGLLPRPEGKGSGSYYTHEHLLKLRLITLLAEAGLKPELIQNSLEGWTEHDMQGLVDMAEGQTFDDLDKIGRWLRKAAPAAQPARRMARDLERFDAELAAPSEAPRRYSAMTARTVMASEQNLPPRSWRPPASPHPQRPSLPSSEHWERIRIGDRLEISYPIKNDRAFSEKIHRLREFLEHLFEEELLEHSHRDNS